MESKESVVSFQIMSDLHLETPRTRPIYDDFDIQPKSPYLCLLGDIGNAYDSRLFQFLELQLQRFDIVFYVIGNHEPYSDDRESKANGAYSTASAIMEEFEASTTSKRNAVLDRPDAACVGQFVLLDRKRIDLSDTITILGCTLYSHIVDSQRSTVSLFVSDFSNIVDWTVNAHNAAHQADLEWLNREVDTITRAAPHRTIAIFTHYSPTALQEANDPMHLEDIRGVKTAFIADLAKETCWTSPAVRLWAFGHTHFNCDFVDPCTGKRVVANQRGYGREDTFDFDPDKVIVLN